MEIKRGTCLTLISNYSSLSGLCVCVGGGVMENKRGRLLQPRERRKHNQRGCKSAPFYLQSCAHSCHGFKTPSCTHYTLNGGQRGAIQHNLLYESWSLTLFPQVELPQNRISNINLTLGGQIQSPRTPGHLAWQLRLISYVKLISSAVFTQINMDGTNLRQSNCAPLAMARATVKKALTQQVRCVYAATVS